MKIARFSAGGQVALGVVEGEGEDARVRPVGPDSPQGAVEIAMAVRADPDLTLSDSGEALPLADVQLLAPVPRPPSLRDFYAFEQHVATARRNRGLEVHPDWYEIPVFYFSNPAAVVGPDAVVPVPPRSQRLDYELEVAVVLGAGGRDLRPDAVDPLIAGYCVMNDWSARDVQLREMLQSMGPVKGKDFATSLGPVLVTADEFAPGGIQEVPSAQMVARVNGTEYSRADLSTLWWSFAEMLSYASESADLQPGDVIGSGTCGTGCILELSLVHGEQAYPWLAPGDHVELEVDGLGLLANAVGEIAAAGWSADGDRTRPDRWV